MRNRLQSRGQREANDCSYVRDEGVLDSVVGVLVTLDDTQKAQLPTRLAGHYRPAHRLQMPNLEH